MSDVPRMIEGGIRYDHRSIRARLAEEEFEVRVRILVPPSDADEWLVLARRFVDAHYQHGMTTTDPNSAWVELGRTKFLDALARGVDRESIEAMAVRVARQEPFGTVTVASEDQDRA